MLEVQGKIHEILPILNLKGSFYKREFILAIEQEQYISFDTIGEQIKLLEKYKLGDQVIVIFRLKGKLWMNPKGEKKYYNTLEVIDIQFAIN